MYTLLTASRVTVRRFFVLRHRLRTPSNPACTFADVGTFSSLWQIVVGTPGRVYDMIQRGVLRLTDARLFVLDEADEMLSRGFKDQIYDVFKYLPESIQVRLPPNGDALTHDTSLTLTTLPPPRSWRSSGRPLLRDHAQ